MAGDDVEDDPAAHYYVPGVPLRKPELVAEIRERNLRSVSAVFAALADGREDPKSKVGLASLLKTIWAGEYDDERDARFINDRVHANIQRDGTFSVIPRIYGGVTSAAQLRRIADVADKHQVPMVKITGGQRIDLLGIPKDKLPEVWRDLGMPSGHAYAKAFRTCKTCVGTEFCRYGVGDSTALGIAIEKRFQGLESPHKMKLATAGCPRNCSEATTKDLGAVAIEGGRWEVYIGGGAGSKVRKGDVLCIVDTHDEVLQVMGRFMQYYREHARVPGAHLRLRRARRHRRAEARCWSTTPRASARRSTRRCRPRSTPSSIPGKRRRRRCTRCSSPPSSRPSKRSPWHERDGDDVRLGSIDDIPLGEGRVFRIDGRDVAVFRCRNGEVHATEATCPHRGGPLADGLVGDHSVDLPAARLRLRPAHGRRARGASATAWPRIASPSRRAATLTLDLT